MKLVDRVAYINHDIDDAIRAGVLHTDELPPGPVGAARPDRRRGASTPSCTTSSRRASAAGDIRQTARMGEAMLELRAFLFDHVYGASALRVETERAMHVVRALFARLCDHPERLSADPRGERSADACDGSHRRHDRPLRDPRATAS